MTDPDIAAGLAANAGMDRTQRRAKLAAAAWRPDREAEAMRRLHKADPNRFAQEHGARGDLVVGMYIESAAAAGVDLDGPDEPEAA